MAEAGSLNIDLGLNAAKFQEGIARAQRSMSDFEKAVKPLTSSLNKFGKSLESTGQSFTKGLTVPILAAGAAVGASLKHFADYGSSINDMSVRTGFSTDSLQELGFAAKMTGVDMGSVELGARKLTKAIGEAAGGNKKTADMFNQLGVQIKNVDGSLRPANEVFKDTVNALNKIPDETTRNVVGMQLLGKGYGDLVPLVKLGADGLDAYAQEARDAGLVMSEEGVSAADAFGDKMDKLQAQISHAGMEVAEAFMPVIEDLMSFINGTVIPGIQKFADWFKSLSKEQKEWIVGIAGAAAALGPMMIIIGKISTGLGSLIKNVAGISGWMKGFMGTIGGVVTLLVGLGAIIMQSVSWSGGWSNLWNDMKEDMANFVNYARGAGKVIGGVLTGDLATIQKGINEFDEAVNKGAVATVERFNRHAQATKEAKTNTDALKASGEEFKTGNDAINVSLEKTNKLFTENKMGDWMSALQGGKSQFDETTLAVNNMNMEIADTAILIPSTVQAQMSYISASMAMQEANMKLTESMKSIGDSMKADLAGSIGESLGALAAGAGDVDKAFKDIFIIIFNALKKVGMALIATGIPLIALGPPAAAKGIQQVAVGTAEVAAASAGIAVVNGFAQGGLVFGETLGLVGEGRGTSKSNPEVIAPLDKLQGFLQPQGSGGQVEFIISGENLKGIIDRTKRSRKYNGS